MKAVKISCFYGLAIYHNHKCFNRLVSCLVDESEDQDEDNDSVEFTVQDGYISYGSAVKLVCCTTGLSLPKLVRVLYSSTS